jgi:hypothetical protein
MASLETLREIVDLEEELGLNEPLPSPGNLDQEVS